MPLTRTLAAGRELDGQHADRLARSKVVQWIAGPGNGVDPQFAIVRFEESGR